MNYEFCLNPLSLPVDTKEHANEYLTDIFRGIADLLSTGSSGVLYSDASLDKTFLAADWTYGNYKSELIYSQEHDLASFVLELDTRSPFLDYVNNEDFCCLTKYQMKMFGKTPLVSAEHDIIKFACLKNAVLVSLPTTALCQRESIPITLIDEAAQDSDEITLFNIFNAGTTHIPRDDWKNSLSDNILFSSTFDEWYCDLSAKNKLHVASLIKRADVSRFTGTTKQTKAIINSSNSIREWRGGCPDVGSGRIRILYKSDKGRVFILFGFIKISPHDYTAAVTRAETALLTFF
ncbi:MAG: hypothetical protein LBR16_03030 [Treponema sp.]|jgi:hypothetical protein|nr:hypothetical protein [Treponema sp.]